MLEQQEYARPSKVLTRDVLEQKYIVENKSAKDIAKELNLRSRSSVTEYLDKFNLIRPIMNNRSKNISKEELYQDYVVEQQDLRTVARKYGFRTSAPITRLLKQYNIPKRHWTKTKSVLQVWHQRKSTPLPYNYWRVVMRGASTRNFEVEITLDEAYEKFKLQNGLCAISGLPIRFYEPGEKPNAQTASLDRIDSSKGYTIDNIQWLHKRVNIMKSDMTDIELINWCHKIVDNYRNNKFEICD